MSEYGLDTTAVAVSALEAGPCDKMLLPIDGAVTKAVGQVVQYNTTNNNYDAFTSDVTAQHYAVLAEASDSVADGNFLCIVRGKVKLNALDTTSKADAEIKTALAKCGIIVVAAGTR
jgi:hypothetical protein